MLCDHTTLRAETSVERDGSATMARVRILCADCLMPFRFVGLPPGIHSEQPTASGDGLEARLPIAPAQSDDDELRCPECDRIMFGPGLHRPGAVVRAIRCGPEHVIRWSDNHAVAVDNGSVRVLVEGEHG